MKKEPIIGFALSAFFAAGITAAVASTEAKKEVTIALQEQAWILNDSANPTSPSSYTLHSGTPADLNNVCEQEEEVCGIAAPADPSNPSQPQIDGSLATEITQGQTTDRVFLGPQSN